MAQDKSLRVMINQHYVLWLPTVVMYRGDNLQDYLYYWHEACTPMNMGNQRMVCIQIHTLCWSYKEWYLEKSGKQLQITAIACNLITWWLQCKKILITTGRKPLEQYWYIMVVFDFCISPKTLKYVHKEVTPQSVELEANNLFDYTLSMRKTLVGDDTSLVPRLSILSL